MSKSTDGRTMIVADVPEANQPALTESLISPTSLCAVPRARITHVHVKHSRWYHSAINRGKGNWIRYEGMAFCD
jgi:hypothetical protein